MTSDTARQVRPIALAPGASAAPAVATAALAPLLDGTALTDTARADGYREDIGLLRRRYDRRARVGRTVADGVSLLLVATGAVVGFSSLDPRLAGLTASLGVAVILLEGVTRVFRPGPRAVRARWVVQRLDREIRLYEARAGAYHGSDAKADAAFVTAVERVLERAEAAEEHDDAGSATVTAARRSG